MVLFYSRETDNFVNNVIDYLNVEFVRIGDKEEIFLDNIDLIKSEFKITETKNLSIELRDNLGLSDISNAPVYGNGTLKTNSFNLMLGYEFKL